jgi:hypothetical protein
MTTKATYDWRLTVRKALIRMGVSAGLIVCASMLSALNSGAVPPKYIYFVPLAHALLAALNNWFKNIDLGVDEGFPDYDQ